MAGRQPAGAAQRRRLSARRARLIGLAGFLAATALPFVLWHRAIWIISSDFRFDSEYLVSGWTGYMLIGLGLLFLAPVVISIGRNPDSRLYPRSRNAYFGWGVTLYLLGLALAAQVAAVARDQALP